MNNNIKRYTLRINSELLNKLRIIADYEERTINQQLAIIIRNAINKYQQKTNIFEHKKT